MLDYIFIKGGFNKWLQVRQAEAQVQVGKR